MKIKEPEKTCKLGQGVNCCAFLAVGPRGFECLVDDPVLEYEIRDRLSKGMMNAKGEGFWEGCLCRETK